MGTGNNSRKNRKRFCCNLRTFHIGRRWSILVYSNNSTACKPTIRRFHRLVNKIFDICEQAGFHVEGRIVLDDKK